ncbi:hypothetical protein LEP1GSC071_1951 [Leptospira santarosai str. JET]|nr:hypothetical protein LEP1GSC071_1951 [Leptospira santarosai str. JET]
MLLRCGIRGPIVANALLQRVKLFDGFLYKWAFRLAIGRKTAILCRDLILRLLFLDFIEVS